MKGASDANQLDYARSRDTKAEFHSSVQAIGRVANREYEQALEIIHQNISRGGPHGPHMEIFRAVALIHLNRIEDARLVIEGLNNGFPDYGYKGWLAYWLPGEEHFTVTWNRLSELGLLSQSKSTGP